MPPQAWSPQGSCTHPCRDTRTTIRLNNGRRNLYTSVAVRADKVRYQTGWSGGRLLRESVDREPHTGGRAPTLSASGAPEILKKSKGARQSRRRTARMALYGQAL